MLPDAAASRCAKIANQRNVIMSTRRKPRPAPARAEIERQREALLNFKAATKDKAVRRMIDLAIKGLEEGVPRMTPEEIYESLGRGHG